MRKLKLLIAACALILGAGQMWAQTDVTSTYLTNTDFSGTYSEVTATPTAVSNDRKIYQPNGWNIDLVNKSANNMTVIKNGDPQQPSNFNDTYAPGDGKYMVRFRDNQTSEYIELSQTITITEAGLYFLSADLIRENSSKAIVELFAGSQKVGNSQDGAWETRYLLLNVSANQEIKIGVKFSNKGAGGHKAGADNIKLEKLDDAPVDVTNLVYNPNFDSDIKGWTAPSGGAKLANNKTDQTTNFYETWNADPKQGRMYQVLEGLPQGTYKLKVFAFADQKGTMTPANTDVCVYAQGQEVGTTSSSHIHRNYVNSTDFTYYETWAYVDATGKLEIGMRQDVATFRWLGMDNVTLQYVSSENQEDALLLAELQTKWNSIITDWNDNVLNGATYANIKGVERATFATEMATATAASITTIADYKTNATADLANAYLGFINPDVKTSYDNLAAAITAAEAAGVDATAAKAVRDAAETTAAAAQNAATLLNNTVEVKDATTTVPVVTDFVVNGTFDDDDISMWKCNSNFQNKGRKTTDDNDAGNMNNTKPWWENWNGDPLTNKMYQTINNIPNGTYRLDISAFAKAIDGDNSYVFANDDKTSLTNDATTGADYQVYTVVTNNTIEIGLEQTTATAKWMGIDNVSLRYYGAGDVINDAKNAAHKLAWEEAKAAAETAIANAAYANVTGEEKSDLETEIAKAEPNTAQGYDDAAAALIAKTSTFIAAKANYDEYVAAKTDAEALEADGVDVPTTAAAAITAAQTLKVNQYNKVQTTYTYDVTSAYVGEWTKTNIGSTSGEHWSGDSRSYMDDWRTSGNSSAIQTLELPAGKFVLKVAARGQTACTITMSTDGKTVTFTSKESTGRGVDLTGAANFSETADTYANGNNGYGWEWRFIPLDLAVATDVEVTLSIVRSGTAWASFTDFAVLKSSHDAGTSDYAALEAAINDAEAKTLGFEKDEYAPYVNAAALKALAAANAIDRTVANEVDVVTNATAALTSATWTANTEEVNAVANGNFANNESMGWEFSAWGEFVSGLNANTNASNGTARSSNAGTLTYGNTTGYTMPLKDNTVYRLTFKVSSWDDNNKNAGTDVSILNSSNEGLAVTSFGASNINRDQADAFKTYTTVFKTGAAGNYTLVIKAKGNRSVYTDIVLKKAAPETITVTSAGYATYVSDNDLDYTNVTGLTAYKATFDTDGETINFTKVTTVPAGEGVLLKGEANNYSVPVTTGVAAWADDYNDFIRGTGAAVESIDGTTHNYVLSSHGGNVGFYPASGKTIATNKAYLSTTKNAVRLTMTFDGEASGISTVITGNISNEAIYNLNGQRINTPRHGLYIQNGKKFMVK